MTDLRTNPSKDENQMNFEQLNFSIFCIGSVAEALGINDRKAYHLLKQSGILDEYVIPSYDVLHTFGKKYLTNDIIECMKEKGVIA